MDKKLAQPIAFILAELPPHRNAWDPTAALLAWPENPCGLRLSTP
jgi:hypothetical protein